MAKNIFSDCFIQEEKFKPETLGGNKEIVMRQLTIDEVIKLEELRVDETKRQKDLIIYAVCCSVVDEPDFKEEKLQTVNIKGWRLVQEIYNQIPLIGMTKKEKEEYQKNIKDMLDKTLEDEQVDEVEDEEGKQKE